MPPPATRRTSQVQPQLHQMTSFGRSLRIYLADGTASGIRLAEIVNWTGQAVACPRTRFSDLGAWPEVARPGVYLLIEGGLGTDKGRVYIGESDNAHERLGSHLLEKEFWTEAVIFSSKDMNLTKAHVRYLEARLISLAKIAGRYDVDNGNAGQPSPLPRADQDAMEEFLNNARTVLGALGHRLLEPLAKPPTTATQNVAGAQLAASASVLSTPLQFEFLGLVARGFVTDEGFTVLRGSQVAKELQPSVPPHVRALRESAEASGSLREHDGYFEGATDMAFASSSTAASFVSGSSRSGPQSWHSATGVSLKDIERAAVKATFGAPDT